MLPLAAEAWAGAQAGAEAGAEADAEADAQAGAQAGTQAGAPWPGGLWPGGLWPGGLWPGGLWPGGLWPGGLWPGGLWPGGLWPGGLWPGGLWPGGLWPGGLWPGGLWPGGLWPGGLWPGGLWPGGLWPGGLWPGGLWPGGLWPGGLWPGGLWPSDFGSTATWVVVVTVVALVFVESGVLVGFLLPGDSLLFAAGLLVADRAGPGWLIALAAGVFAAAVAGVGAGYWTGLRLGRPWLQRRSERMAGHLHRAERFYARYGWWALVVARFIPWLRTFTPVVAGAARMPLGRLMSANLVGAAVWGPGLVLVGYTAHTRPVVRTVAYTVAGTAIALSVLLPLAGWLRTRWRARSDDA